MGVIESPTINTLALISSLAQRRFEDLNSYRRYLSRFSAALFLFSSQFSVLS